jgi:hypothetical protein
MTTNVVNFANLLPSTALFVTMKTSSVRTVVFWVIASLTALSVIMVLMSFVVRAETPAISLVTVLVQNNLGLLLLLLLLPTVWRTTPSTLLFLAEAKLLSPITLLSAFLPTLT